MREVRTSGTLAPQGHRPPRREPITTHSPPSRVMAPLALALLSLGTSMFNAPYNAPCTINDRHHDRVVRAVHIGSQLSSILGVTEPTSLAALSKRRSDGRLVQLVAASPRRRSLFRLRGGARTAPPPANSRVVVPTASRQHRVERAVRVGAALSSQMARSLPRVA